MTSLIKVHSRSPQSRPQLPVASSESSRCRQVVGGGVRCDERLHFGKWRNECDVAALESEMPGVVKGMLSASQPGVGHAS